MFKQLNPFQKFQKGSSFWFIFFEPDRALFKHINWKTRFLLQDVHKKNTISKPLLIDTYNIFPNLALLCLPFKKDLWISDIYKQWNQLDKPSLRVFTPLGFSGQTLNLHWPSSDPVYSLSYYSE